MLEEDASEPDEEVVDGLPVVAEPGVVEERSAAAGLVPARQAAAPPAGAVRWLTAGSSTGVRRGR